MTQPSGLKNLLRAAAGALPVVPRTDQLPNRTVTVEELPIDPANVAAYAAVTGLRYGNQVPLTYPFALTFPSVMSLVTGFDFPFAAMGAIHTENRITQYRPIAVTDAVGVRVRAENLREHRRGLLVDLVTNVSVGNDVAWHQVTTFLHQQRTSLSGEPKPPPQKKPKLPPPAAVLRITPAKIRRYAAVGGDHNPIHTNPIAAKLRLPHRHRARDVHCRGGIGEYRSPFSGRGALFGSVRQAGAAAGHRGTLRRRRRWRLGSHAAQYGQGIPPPDRYRAGSIAGATRIGPAWSAIRRYRVPHA